MAKTPSRKIYFAASIRSGREYQPTYSAIIKHLKRYGRVLTEHVGAASLGDAGEEDLTDEQIFRRDADWIRDADILIADASLPSLGVGYEIGFAESLRKPILCLYFTRAEKQLTAMLAGNPSCTVLTYGNLQEALGRIDGFFASLDE